MTSQAINQLINILHCCWFWFVGFYCIPINRHIILYYLGSPLSTACCTGTDVTCNCNAFGLIHPVPDLFGVESVLCVFLHLLSEKLSDLSSAWCC